MTTGAPVTQAEPSRLRRIARAAWQAESGVWVSLGRIIFRRPRVPVGASGFTYHLPIQTILIIFIVLSAVEIPVIDMIVHPWPWVRIPLLIAGIWGVTWMLGLLFGFLTRPHSVGPLGMRVRRGPALDLDLPWEVVASVARSRDVKEKAPDVADEPQGRTLALRMQNECNILIELEMPVDVKLSAGVEQIEAVRLWVDDVDGFLRAVRLHMP